MHFSAPILNQKKYLGHSPVAGINGGLILWLISVSEFRDLPNTESSLCSVITDVMEKCQVGNVEDF